MWRAGCRRNRENFRRVESFVLKRATEMRSKNGLSRLAKQLARAAPRGEFLSSFLASTDRRATVFLIDLVSFARWLGKTVSPSRSHQPSSCFSVTSHHYLIANASVPSNRIEIPIRSASLAVSRSPTSERVISGDLSRRVRTRPIELANILSIRDESTIGHGLLGLRTNPEKIPGLATLVPGNHWSAKYVIAELE